MPRLPGRRKLERNLAALLRSIADQATDFRGVLDLDKLRALAVKELRSVLGSAFSVAAAGEIAGKTIDAARAGISAEAWSQGAAADIANRLVTNLAGELASGAPIDAALHPDRFAGIAATEITRAATAGEQAVITDAAGSVPSPPAPPSVTDSSPRSRGGAVWLVVPPGYKAVWFNSEFLSPSDNPPCPLCTSLHLKEQSEWEKISGGDWEYVKKGPPAHPYCRCHVEYIPDDWDPADVFEWLAP